MGADFYNTPYGDGILEHSLWTRNSVTPLMGVEFSNTPYECGLLQHTLWTRTSATSLMGEDFGNTPYGRGRRQHPLLDTRYLQSGSIFNIDAKEFLNFRFFTKQLDCLKV